MIRPRATHVLLLIVGFFVSIAIFAIAMSKLSHLAPASTPTPGGAPAGTAGAAAATVRHTAAHAHDHGLLTFGHVLLLFAISAALGAVVFARWATRVVRERLENRLTREYGLYELRLSLHDEAREQDVADMVEALLHAVREFPQDRAREGQPFIAIEAHFAPGVAGELEWVLCVRCEQALAQTIDGILSSAYPDVRLGYEFTGPPREIGGVLPEPGHVLRFRKARSFIYPIVSEVQPHAARPLEAIAQAQAALGEPSTVRFQLTPCALAVERYARERLRGHEDRLAIGDGGVLGSLEPFRDDRRGLEPGSRVVLARGSGRVPLAGDSEPDRRRGARASRGEPAAMPVDDRAGGSLPQTFPDRVSPLLPSLRTLASSSEIAHLIALPGARLKNVPVRRLALPRIPAPPELGMVADDPAPQMPPDRGVQR